MDAFKFTPHTNLNDWHTAEFDIAALPNAERYAYENTAVDQIVLLGQFPGTIQPLLYRFANVGLQHVFEAFNIGYRSGSNDPQISKLMNQLETISQTCTMIPYLASSACLKLKIDLPLGLDAADLIDNTLTHFAADPMLDEDSTISDTIAVSGRMHFFWD